MSIVATANEYYTANPEAQQTDMAVLQGLLARSATDVQFRQRLLADSRAAVSEFTGREIPESFNVVFIENAADATIVLPPVIEPTSELSESELEAVAGGSPVVISLIAVAGFTVGAAAYLMGAEK